MTLRVCIGARLRRALRGADYAARLHAILTVMRDLETHAAREARRVRCGLTRLRILYPTPTIAPPLACAPLAAIACDDSS